MPETGKDLIARLPLRERDPANPGFMALDNIRVLDFTRALAGPQATQVLGDFGADIIKVEMPGKGDDSRMSLPQHRIGGESAFFLALNRNKRSIAVDINSDAGREIILDLLETCDVLVENFTSRVMRRIGLDYASLKERFPRLIYCSVSAYGRTGSLSEAAGFDTPVSAEAGLCRLNSRPGEAPTIGGTPWTDLTTGLNAAIAILIALQARSRTGMGQMVEAAMYDTALSNLTFRGYECLVSGEEPRAIPVQALRGIPRGQFATQDGVLVITAGGDKMFRAFATQVIDKPEWAQDPRLATDNDRAGHAEELLGAINAILQGQTSAYWSQRCKAAGVPCGIMKDVGEALLSPETAEREMVYRVPHPTAGAVPVIANPARLWGTPQETAAAPPLLGQHTREILAELAGYDEARVSALIEQGVIGALG